MFYTVTCYMNWLYNCSWAKRYLHRFLPHLQLRHASFHLKPGQQQNNDCPYQNHLPFQKEWLVWSSRIPPTTPEVVRFIGNRTCCIKEAPAQQGRLLQFLWWWWKTSGWAQVTQRYFCRWVKWKKIGMTLILKLLHTWHHQKDSFLHYWQVYPLWKNWRQIDLELAQ